MLGPWWGEGGNAAFAVWLALRRGAAAHRTLRPKPPAPPSPPPKASNTIRVYNNGLGIPVEVHKEEGVHVPELIFGHLLTSSNYNDKDAKARGFGGVGGEGARDGGRAGLPGAGGRLLGRGLGGCGWGRVAAAVAVVGLDFGERGCEGRAQQGDGRGPCWCESPGGASSSQRAGRGLAVRAAARLTLDRNGPADHRRPQRLRRQAGQHLQHPLLRGDGRRHAAAAVQADLLGQHEQVSATRGGPLAARVPGACVAPLFRGARR